MPRLKKKSDSQKQSSDRRRKKTLKSEILKGNSSHGNDTEIAGQRSSAPKKRKLKHSTEKISTGTSTNGNDTDIAVECSNVCDETEIAGQNSSAPKKRKLKHSTEKTPTRQYTTGHHANRNSNNGEKTTCTEKGTVELIMSWNSSIYKTSPDLPDPQVPSTSNAAATQVEAGDKGKRSEMLMKKQLQGEIKNKKMKDRDRKRKTREEMVETMKLKQRQLNRLQQQKRRQKMTEEQKKDSRNIDKTKHKDKRSQMTDEQKKDTREIDKAKHKDQRSQMTDEQKKDTREIDKAKHKDQRSQMTDEQKKDAREINKAKLKEKISQMTDEQKKDAREIDKAKHKDRRSQLTDEHKKDTRKIDKAKHKDQRSQMTDEQKKDTREIDKAKHKDQRSQMTDEQKKDAREINKAKLKEKISQMTDEQKKDAREIDKAKHKDRRSQLTDEHKKDTRKIDKAKHKDQRSQMKDEQKKDAREINKAKHKDRRSQLTDEQRSKCQQRSATSKQNKRQEKRTTVNELYASYQENLSTTHDAVHKVVKSFLKVIQGGPTFTCCICYRMLYRNSVKCFTEKYKEKLSTLSINVGLPEEELNWICQTCSSCLMREKIPAQALCNNMKLSQPHPIFNRMCNLEKQLVSKIIPFMKIYSLPKGSQQGLKGQVVLVPSNIQSTANSLPRDTGDAQIIALNLKRRLSDKQTFCKEFIRPQLVNEAFQILKDTNKHYEHITVNENWIDNSKVHDEQLWTKTCTDQETITIEDDTSDNDNNVESPDVTDSEDEVEKDIPLTLQRTFLTKDH